MKMAAAPPKRLSVAAGRINWFSRNGATVRAQGHGPAELAAL